MTKLKKAKYAPKPFSQLWPELAKSTSAPPNKLTTTDPVKHPSHYTTGKIEVWDFIVDQDLSYLAGNVIKYISRYRHKGNAIQDLEKARAYLDKLINTELSKKKIE